MAVSPRGKEKKSYLWLKYSGMAFQLAIIIFLAAWGGKLLDDYLHNKTPYFTIGLILLLFSGFMYKLYVDLSKTDK